MTRTTWFGLASMLALSSVVACGDDEKPGATATTAGAGGQHAAGGQSGAGGGGGSSNACNPIVRFVGGGMVASCPALDSCLQTQCSNELMQCFGPGYLSGNYAGGQCETEVACFANCNCESTCERACPAASTACTDCEPALLNCALQQCQAASACP